MGEIVEEAKEKKRLEAQKKRLKSLSERRHVQEKRKNLIAHSLNSAPSTGRIVFDSDDDESQVKKVRAEPGDEEPTGNGVDKRFQLDERFFSASESEDEEETKFEEEYLSSSDDDKALPSFPAFYSVDEKFVEQLKVKKENAASDSGFSFLSLMGREKPEMSKIKSENSGVPTVDKMAENSSKPISLPKSTADNSLKFVRDALMSGVPDEKHKNHPIFAVNMEEIRSVASSFRRHNPEHVKKNWNKHRDAFIKIYKRQRRLALKELKDKKPPINRYKKPHQPALNTEPREEDETKAAPILSPSPSPAATTSSMTKARTEKKLGRITVKRETGEVGEENPRKRPKKRKVDPTLFSSEENVSRARRRRRKAK